MPLLLRLHRLTGWLFFAVFLATGFYLHFRILSLIEGNEAARYTLRANHIYILMAALVNLALAAANPLPGRRPALRQVGRVLVLLAPAVLFAAFIVEGPHPTPHLLERPLTVAGVFALVIGVLLAVARARPANTAAPSRS